MTLFVLTVATFEFSNTPVMQYEMTIESVSELESSESESISDIADLVKSSTIFEMYHKNLSFSDGSFVLFTLTKDIFRPPRFA